MNLTLPTVLETQHLYVRPWLETDLAPLRQLLTDPQVARLYCPDGKPMPEDDIRAIWSWGLRARSGWTPGFFNCPVVERASDAVIGRAGINPLWIPGVGANPKEPELEWALLPAYWGRGLATELGRGLIQYGFKVAGFDHLIAFTAPEHLASQRVMQKIGMTFDRRDTLRGEDCVIYRMERSAYMATQGGQETGSSSTASTTTSS
jgi:[ribosomal protein S5]-alanine N-acetyltransferase